MKSWCALLLSLLALPAVADESPKLFDSREPLAIELQSDFNNLLEQAKGYMSTRTVQRTPVPGLLKADGHELSAEFEIRGRYRLFYCKNLPPLKIILPKGKRPAPFQSIDRDLKLVSSCYPDIPDYSKRAPNALRRELLQYHLLEAAGLPAFRARLVNVTYLYLDGTPLSQGQGFVIENIKDVAKRYGLLAESSAADPKSLRYGLELSERFLRNDDFEIESGQNVRTVTNSKGEPLAYLAYDFDLSKHTKFESREDGIELKSFLSKMLDVDSPRAQPYLRKFILNKDSLLAEVEKSGLPQSEMNYFRDWIELFVSMCEKVITEHEQIP